MAGLVDGSSSGLEARVDKLETDIMAHVREIHGLERKITQLDRKFTSRFNRVDRQLTGIREQMADLQRVLIAKLNVFIETQGGINRDVESRLPPRAPSAKRRRA